MPQHRLNCSCGDAVIVDTSQAGDTTNCPACGATIQVPPFRTLKELPLVEAEVQQAAVWSVRRNLLFVVMLCCAGASLAGLASSTFLRKQMAVDFTTEEWIESEKQSIDQMLADEALGLWNSMLSDGLERTVTPYFLTLKRREAWLTFWMKACGIGFAASVLAVGMIFLTAPRPKKPPATS